jgi:hypothetical protein
MCLSKWKYSQLQSITVNNSQLQSITVDIMCVHSLAKSVSVWCIQCQLHKAVFAKVFACSAALRALHAIPVTAVTSGQCSLTCPQDEIHFPALSAGTRPNDGQRWQQLGQKKSSTQAMCAWSSTLEVGP